MTEEVVDPDLQDVYKNHVDVVLILSKIFSVVIYASVKTADSVFQFSYVVAACQVRMLQIKMLFLWC